MSHRPHLGTSSHVQPSIVRPSLVRRNSSQRPRNYPRTRSYTGAGSIPHGIRTSDQSRQISHAPRRDLTPATSPSNRPDISCSHTTANTILHRASSRPSQPAHHHSGGGGGVRGISSRVHQSLQQTIARNPLGHRTGMYRAEVINTREHHHHSSTYHSNPPAHIAILPDRRSQPRSSALVHHSRPGILVDPRTDQTHGSRGLVQAGGSRPHH